jgi:hypothetical protein
MAGNANRNVSVDITGDSSDLDRAYDNASKKSDDLAKKQEDNAKKSDSLFKKSADVAASGFSSVFDMLGMIGKMGPANLAIVAGALIALGPASMLAAGGITLGLGSALLSIGIMAASQSSVVRGEFSRLAEDVKSDTVDIAQPLVQSLLKVPGVARNVFGQFKPELRDAFANLAPVFDEFVQNMGKGLAQFVPAIKPIQEGFSALLTSIGIEAPTIFGNLASALTTLANTASDHSDDIAGLLVVVTGFVSGTATVLSAIADAWDKSMATIEDGIGGVGGALMGWQPDLDNSDLKWKTISQTLLTSASRLNENKLVMDDLTVSADQLKLAIDELNNVHLKGDMALSAYSGALEKAREIEEKNYGAVSLSTEAGRKNYDVIFQLVKASQAYILAKAEEGATTEELTALYVQHRGQLKDVIEQMGFGSEKAKQLTDRYMSIPKDINTKLSADTSGAQNAVDNFITLNSGRRIPIDVYNRNSQLKDGGLAGRDGYATGGPVRGPGGSRTDSIPTRVSRGEYIVNAASTRRNLPLLESINSGKGVGGMMGTTIIYQISTSVAPTANLAAVGGAVVEAIQSYEQRSGKSWRNN